MEKSRADVLLVISAIFVILLLIPTYTSTLDAPRFKIPVENVTIAIGREAILDCAVENLYPYKVAWLKVDTQTILTIHNHVITKNNRIGVSHNELNIWHLHVREVRESDQGWYMCQINTDPMRSQIGYLNVVVPPDILDYPTSADMVVDEGSNVSLQCIAKGSPEPSITWKRENGDIIHLQNGSDVLNINGPVLSISNVKRGHMGPYLCIASNGIPPSVSKRIKLVVQFSPSVWIQYQLIGAYDGQQITLECYSQAFPKSINYWAKDPGGIIPQSFKYVHEIIEEGYNVHMKLKINSLEARDYGVYQCISKNSLGEMEGSINVYRLPDPNKLLINNRKQNYENVSRVFGIPHILSGGKMTRNNSNDTTLRRISAENDQLDLQGYYSCAYRIHSLSLFTIILIFIYM